MKKIQGKQIESVGLKQVTMPQDLKITKAVGEITIPSGQKYATISKNKDDGSEKTAWELINEIFSKDNTISTQTPKATITSNKPNLNSFVEVGDSVVPSPVITFNPGSYKYGSTANTTNATTPQFDILKYKASVYYNDIKKQELKQESAEKSIALTFDSIVLTDEGKSVTIRASVDHNASNNTPLTQLGNRDETHKIQEGTATADPVTLVTSYLKVFYGFTDETDFANLTSEAIRSLGGSTNEPFNRSFNPITDLYPEVGNKSLIIAIPSNNTKGTVSVSYINNAGLVQNPDLEKYATLVPITLKNNTNVNYTLYTYKNDLGLNTSEPFTINLNY